MTKTVDMAVDVMNRCADIQELLDTLPRPLSKEDAKLILSLLQDNQLVVKEMLAAVESEMEPRH